MLIFVPTNYVVNENDIGVHKDNQDAMYTIINNKLAKVGVADASNYIRAFQREHLNDFTIQGTTVVPHFQETTNLWYDIRLFEPGTNPYDNTTGMVSFLRYIIDKRMVDKVVISLAAFDRTKSPQYFYQIMLIFKFYKNVTLKFAFSGKNSILTIFDKYPDREKGSQKFLSKFTNDQMAVIRKFVGSFGYTDTGVPCPPPPSGQTCGQLGASLP